MACGPQCRTGPEFDPDYEGPSEDDIQRFGADFVTCPNCSSDVYDQAAVCPTCGMHLGDTASITDKKRMSPALIAVIAVLVMAAFALVYVL